jgi:uncharacterized pyridoxal phosphate-containing UPF0001 family protein
MSEIVLFRPSFGAIYVSEGKSGCKPEEAPDIVSHVINACPKLKFAGLMTIGLMEHDYDKGPNPDFQVLSDFSTQCLCLNSDVPVETLHTL